MCPSLLRNYGLRSRYTSLEDPHWSPYEATGKIWYCYCYEHGYIVCHAIILEEIGETGRTRAPDSAGITTIIKTAKLPRMLTDDLCNSFPTTRLLTPLTKFAFLTALYLPNTDDTVDPIIWDAAEGSITIVAACIPTLRVLIRTASGNSTPDIYSVKLPTIGSATGQGWSISHAAKNQSPQPPHGLTLRDGASQSSTNRYPLNHGIWDGTKSGRLILNNDVEVDYEENS